MMIIILLYLHFTFTFAINCDMDDLDFSCGNDSFMHCFCGRTEYVGKQQFVVNCTNIGLKDSSLLQFLPEKTQVLIFVGNDIPELPVNIFGLNANHSCLKVIDMSNNKIREIHGKAYHKVTNVERLILNHNDITITSSGTDHHPRIFSNFENLLELHLTNAFADESPEELSKNLHDIFLLSGLNKLRKLHLEQNGIKNISDILLFCPLSNLMDLHLGDNKLQHINFKLDCLHKLRFLDLERNSIVYLTKEELSIFDEFPKRKQNLVIDINGNPFTCGYQIEELYSWLQNTSVDVRNKNKLKCKHKTKEQESVLMDFYGNHCLNHSDSNILGEGTESSNVVRVLSVVLVITLCLLIYTNRTPIKMCTLPLLYSLSQKVQYTTIGKNEAQEMEV